MENGDFQVVWRRGFTETWTWKNNHVTGILAELLYAFYYFDILYNYFIYICYYHLNIYVLNKMVV